MDKVIISVLGPDKPGILAAISKSLFSQNCNVENVSQTSLQSEFAGIFIISKPEALSTDTINSHLKETLAPLDLHVQVKDLVLKDTDSITPTEPFVITTRGPDRKGLVGEIFQSLGLKSIGVINRKTTATRLIPVPGKAAGDHAYFGGLLGEATIIPVSNSTGSNDFIRLGGLIPAPIQSLTN